jgi:hypothetical protein
VDVGALDVELDVGVDVAVAEVVALDEGLGPDPPQGDPLVRMLFASWAYVHPLMTFESENPALHIMTPPNAALLL